jgi:hypothetical protein
MLEYVILYYYMFIVFPIKVYFLPYVVLGLLLTTHCLSINRDLCNIVIMNTTSIQCSPLFSSAPSLFYIFLQYIVYTFNK